MFEWLRKPGCPCDNQAKAWVESRLDWLSHHFPDNVYAGRRMVLPSDRFFPDSFSADERGARALAGRVAAWMGVDLDRIDLRISDLKPKIDTVNQDGHAMPGAAGLYIAGGDRITILISRDELQRPADLVGTLAHEFAHERLMGEERVCGDEFDNELLTDLTVVHLGLGIFLANSPRNWRSQQSRWPGSKLSRPEYLSPPMFGYALAHVAWHMAEERPAWQRHLGSAVRADFDQAARFLFKTGGSEFVPGRGVTE